MLRSIAFAAVVAVSVRDWKAAGPGAAPGLSSVRTRSALVPFDHPKCLAGHESEPACNATENISLSDGELFDVVISHTDTSRFQYTIAGVKIPTGAAPQGVTKAADSQTDMRTLWAKHDKQFGGYVVTISRRTDAPTATNDKDLGNATIRISVKTRDWQLDFSSGFTVSGLTDPAYALKEDTLPHAANETAHSIDTLIEEPGRRDKAARGVAAFVNVWHNSIELFGVNPGLGFGLGLDQGRGSAYYFGPTVRLGDKALVAGGYVLGSVKTTPPGHQVNQPVKDANVLNQLGQRTAGSWFLGLSYAFAGTSQDPFKKPFAGASATTTPQSGPGDTPPKTADAAAQYSVTADPLQVSIDANQSQAIKVTVLKGTTPISKDTITFAGLKSSFSFSPEGTAAGDSTRTTIATDDKGTASIAVKMIQGGQVSIHSKTAGNTIKVTFRPKPPSP